MGEPAGVATEGYPVCSDPPAVRAAGAPAPSLIGLVTGIISSTRQSSLFDTASMTGALFGISTPIFWLALLLLRRQMALILRCASWKSLDEEHGLP
jgi:hypothetical protein